MNTWHQDMLVVNGLQVRSIAHEICTMIALTGDTSGFKPDFATIVADHTSDAFTLPHLVLDGPSFPSGHIGVQARRGLEALLSGDILGWTDLPQPEHRVPTSTIGDYLERRVGPGRAGRSQLTSRLRPPTRMHSERRADSRTTGASWTATAGTLAVTQVAVDTLSTGLSRCVSMGFGGGGPGWDSHAITTIREHPLFGAFTGLER